MNTVTFTFQTSILYDSTGTPVYGCTSSYLGIPVPKYSCGKHTHEAHVRILFTNFSTFKNYLLLE
jgi:hypothetical protein